MSDLLINWLNDEVQLSKRISNFEQDFHNGYLFGELLSKYSQQLNFNEFIDKDDKMTRIGNFSLLYDTFRTLRVSYDSNIAMAIIEKKTGIAKKLLYELKMQLQKTTSNAFTKLTKPTKPLSPLKKIPLSKDKFDKISKQHFTKQLNQMHKAQKNINLESHLTKFPQFSKKQLMKAEIQQKKQAQARLLGQMKFREKQLDNIKKSADFRNQWEQSNMEKWAANVTIRKIQRQKDQLYKTKIQNSKLQTKTMSELSALKTLDQDIKQFEKKVKADKNMPRDSSSQSEQEIQKRIQPQNTSFLKKKSIKQFPKQMDSNGFELSNKSGIQDTQQQMGLKKKKSPQQVELNRHQRQKKRRKMIVQQNKKQELIKIERRQKYIISTLQQNSKQQKQIEYQIWRAWKNKDIICQNKATRDLKKKDKQETRLINSKFKDDQLTKTYREEHNKIQLKQACNRQQKLRINNSVKDRKQIYNECRGFVQKFVDIMETLYENGQQNNIEDLNSTFVNHLMDEFVADAYQPKSISELEIDNYIKGKGQWKIQIIKDNQEQSQDPTEQNSMPLTQINNYYLGNILKAVFTQLYCVQQVQAKKESNFKFLATLMGLDFSGKTIISEKIKENFGFHLIFINKLIEQKIQDYNQMSNKGIQIDGDTAQIVKLCYEGKSVPNQLILALLKNQVQKHQRCLIVNYPTTYEECVELTQHFGNVKPSDFKKRTKLESKILEFSRLVWPTQSKAIPRSLKPCGVDLGLWIQVSPKTSLDRFLGRRWNSEGQCFHINEEIKNPNDLYAGQKASSTILRNNFKINNKSKIENWLSSFGLQVTDQNNKSVQLCWDAINGQTQVDNVIENALRTFERALRIKQKKQLEMKINRQQAEAQQKKLKQIQDFENQQKQKCVLSKPQQIQGKYEKMIDSSKIDKIFLSNVQQLWNNTEKLTLNSLLGVFQGLRQQDHAKSKYISDTKKKFIRLLTRDDERFFLVKKFQNQYNQFYDQNQDMVSQQYTKQELHQRIEDLQVDLLSIIQQKKDDATLQCQNIMNSGWLQSQIQQIITGVHVLFQTQLNRSFACQQIITDFYSKKYMVPTIDPQQTQLTLSIDDSLQLIKDESFPRLQKLVSEALRLFNKQQDVADDKNKKGGKAPPKKEEKKGAKKGGKDEVQQVKQPTVEELEYKKALNTQKSIYRYRVKIIQSFATRKLEQFQRTGKKLYQNLQDLYKYTDKIEKQSVNNMTKIFKAAIEQEKKIENEVQIHYTQVTETELIRNFQKPKPTIQPASEKYQSSRFNIAALKEFIKLFKIQSEIGSVIKTKRLFFMFQQFMQNQNLRSILPQNWKNLKKQNVEHFVQKFDSTQKGQIEIWIILHIAILSNVSLPTAKQIQSYELLLCDHNPNFKQISQGKLMKTQAWFDCDEPTYENTRNFNRNQYIKQVLFDINQKEDSIILQKFIRRLKLSEYIKQQKCEKTYFQYAFNFIGEKQND